MADAMKLVPVEPTEAMLRAMNEAIEDTPYLGDVEPSPYDQWRPCSEAAYRAMLAASPPAREEAPGEGAGREERCGQCDMAIWSRNPCALGLDPAKAPAEAIAACGHFSDRQAPADRAGDLETAWRILESIPAINDLGAQYQEDIQAAILSALRNRTSEPEAGAVAWRWRLTKNAAGLHRDSRVSPQWQYMEEEVTPARTREVQTLYTHPAPATADKLRTAVEALEGARGHTQLTHVYAGIEQALAALNEQPQ